MKVQVIVKNTDSLTFITKCWKDKKVISLRGVASSKDGYATFEVVYK